MKIDSHQHFWQFNKDDYGWISDDMQNIKRDFLPDDLLPYLKAVGFDGSIAVQARQTLDETRWLLQLAAENSFIKGVVGWVDLQSENVENQLLEFCNHKKAVGVRHVIHDESDVDFMLRPDFIRGVKLLERFGLTYDILIFPVHLRNTIEFVGKFSSNQTFVVDHIAKPLVKSGVIYPWKTDLEELAKYENVYCKVSGIVTEADWQNWTPKEIYPYLDIVFGAFGTNRILIGSDWPVCLIAGDYSKVMSVVMDYIKQFTYEEQKNILGENALKAYRI